MGEARPHAGGPKGPQRVAFESYLKAPRSGPRWAPGGSVQKGALSARLLAARDGSEVCKTTIVDPSCKKIRTSIIIQSVS